MKPLDGVKILDLTQAHAGSLATMLLADFGAEVIKIERLGIGDLARYWEPIKNGGSGYYEFLNRNKKSVSLNAFSEEGREIIFKLVREADVVCENFKYGSMDRMGFDYETLKAVNPKIIYASLNGFGQTGPMKNSIGLDLQLQAMSGIMDRTGAPDGPPTRIGAAFGDHLSGTYMATAINLALINLKKTGAGQRIDIGILDSLVSVLEDSPVTYSLKGEMPPRSGNSYPSIAPYDTFKVKDGYVTIAVSTDRQWQTFCSALGFEELANNPEYKTNELRDLNYLENLKNRLEEKFAAMSRFEIERILTDAGISAGAVRKVSEAMEMPQIKAREMIVEHEDATLGKIAFPSVVIKLEKTPGRVENFAPAMGEHTREYLGKLNYSLEEIESLFQNSIVSEGKKGEAI